VISKHKRSPVFSVEYLDQNKMKITKAQMLKALYDQFGVRKEEASGFLRMVADRLEGE